MRSEDFVAGLALTLYWMTTTLIFVRGPALDVRFSTQNFAMTILVDKPSLRMPRDI